MRLLRIHLSSMIMLAVTGPGLTAGPPIAFPQFEMQEIDSGLTIGYAVITADINQDGQADIIVVDKHQVVWYENPSWKKRLILNGKTIPDNVCITALDIDGGGDLELVLGAAWKPSDTKTPGTLQWLKRGSSLDQEWTMYPIPCDEPTVHRVRAFDIDGDGRPEVVHVPLQGRECTSKGNFIDGRPVRVMAYRVPDDPTQPQNWKPTVLSESLHVCHNFIDDARNPIPGAKANILITAYEGVFRIVHQAGEWKTLQVGEGNQSNPKSNRGASEVKSTNFGPGKAVIATIEPWHGHEVVTYTPPSDGKGLWQRHVIDNHLRWGHAVWFADLDNDGLDELIIGVRDDPNPKMGDQFKERRGVRIYKCLDAVGKKWERLLLEEGGMACEDLTAADLNGDGRIDIIAVGRATGNARIYWNKGSQK